MKKFIFNLQRFNAVSNSTTNTIVVATDDADSITNSGNIVQISAGDGNDTIKNSGNLVTITAGDGNNSVSNSGDNIIITAADGKNTIFNNQGDSVSVSLGEGDNYVSNSSGKYVTISADGGNNRIYNNYGDNIFISTGDGNDSINDSYGANATVSGGAGNDTIYHYGRNYYYSSSSSEDKAVISGGYGDDFIYYVGRDGTITGGAGNDKISLSSGDSRNIFINYNYGDGSDTIYGFSADDTLQIATYGSYTTTRSGDALYFVFDNGSITLEKVGAGVGSANFVTIDCDPPEPIQLGPDEPAPTLPSSTSTPTVPAVTTPSGSSSTPTTPAASSTSTTPAATTPSSSGGNTTIINIGNGGTYIGGDNNGTINYGTINNIEGLTVNNNTITVSNEFTQNLSLSSYSQYSNVINIDGSQLTEAKLLSGNSNNNSIQAGSAGSTLYGGGQGNNTLSGGEGRDFFEFTGSGNDIAQNFTAGTEENSDVVYLTGTSLSSIRRDSNYLSVNTATGKSLQVSNSESVDEAIQYSTNGTRVSAAKIGRANQSNSFTYEDGVNYYRGGNYTDVLNVTSYESRNIRLNRGTFSGINNIDASTSTGNNTLAGDSSNNQIAAGQGNDSLWGGSGSSSDTLIGGGGKDTFFYGKNDGADVIQNASSSDTVNLYNVRVSDISSARVSGNTIMANFKSGGSLQVNGTSSTSSVFKLASGSSWQYNGNRWQRA